MKKKALKIILISAAVLAIAFLAVFIVIKALEKETEDNHIGGPGYSMISGKSLKIGKTTFIRQKYDVDKEFLKKTAPAFDKSVKLWIQKEGETVFFREIGSDGSKKLLLNYFDSKAEAPFSEDIQNEQNYGPAKDPDFGNGRSSIQILPNGAVIWSYNGSDRTVTERTVGIIKNAKTAEIEKDGAAQKATEYSFVTYKAWLFGTVRSKTHSLVIADDLSWVCLDGVFHERSEL